MNEALGRLAEELDLGSYHVPPSWITDEASGLSTEPDGYLVLWGSLEDGTVRLNPAREEEMIGRPDMALEAVSKTSEKKDLVELVEAYARAGVAEYWIADGRAETPTLRILVLGTDGAYHDQPPGREGWIDSPLWKREFRLLRGPARAGLPSFRLEVREPRGA